MGEELTSGMLVEALKGYFKTFGRDLPSETCDLLLKRPIDLGVEELQWYAEKVLSFRAFIVKSLERIYLDSGKPQSWGDLASDNREKSIIESFATEAVESAAAGGAIARVEAEGTIVQEPESRESMVEETVVVPAAQGTTVVVAAEGEGAGDTGTVLAEHLQSPMPVTALAGIEQASAESGVPVMGAPWWRRNLKWLIIGASALVLSFLATLVTVLLMMGGEKTVYAWSCSELIGKDVRIERCIEQKKNAAGSPYLVTFTLSVANQGEESIKSIELEEDIPDIISRREGLSFTVDPEKKKDDLDVVGWRIKDLEAGGVYELSYSLPLQTELSKPQLQEIEEQFDQLIVAFIRLPENKVTCPTCNGSGNNPCGICSTMGSVACPACGGAGTFNCSSCGGKGTSTCSSCSGNGKYYYCSRCRRNLTPSQYYSSYYCYFCGGSPSYQYGPYTCLNCSGTGTAKCGNCGGSGRVKCGTCGGGARVVCEACGGAGQVVCPGCSGGGWIPYTFGWSELY